MDQHYTFWLSLVLLVAFSWPSTSIFAQTGQIAGTVVDQDGEPLTGVNVVIDGTTVGATTNLEGYYEIPGLEPGMYTVVASFVGFATQESQSIVVESGETTELNIVLLETALELGGLVVTALGVEREERSLTTGTQSISPVELAQARELNVAFSLAGRVAGLSVNQAGTGLGGQTRLILRGNRSISGSSQPLFVIDGVPIRGDISDLNQNDISNISVLKGANAAALYGSAAQNGAIIITTNRGGVGTIRARFSTNFTTQQPLILTEFQNEYAQGSGGEYQRNSEFSWGPRMTGQSVPVWDPSVGEAEAGTYQLSPQPNNVADVFQTGYQSASNLSINVGSEAIQGYFSYSYTDARGIVPGNTLQRHNAQVRVTAQPGRRLSVDGKLNYIRSNLVNRLDTGENFSNPIRHAYRLPRNIRTEDAEEFEYFTDSGRRRQNYWVPGSNGGANPYWTLNRNLRTGTNDRIILLGSATYEFFDGLSMMVRGSFDGNAGSGTRTLYADSYIIAQDGRYFLSKGNSHVFNGDALLSYRKSLPNLEIDFDVNLGGNIQKRRNTSLSANTGQSLTVENFFTLSNTQLVSASQGVGSPVDINSVYAFAKIGWRDALYLDLTGRNDWSSTLPEDNWSYFYPSVGISAIVSELLPLPDAISFGRIRASYAQVGNSTSPFRLLRTASLRSGGINGFLSLSGTLPNEELVPEETQSIELGLDMRFLQNRFGFDATYYNTQTQNQLFTVALPLGSGAASLFTNGGDVRNKGVELMVNAIPVRNENLMLDLNVNFSRNINDVVTISEQRPRLRIGGDFLRQYFIEQGEEFGNVYSRGFLRDDQGRVIVGENGVPKVTPGNDVLVANYNPDWLGSFAVAVSWKSWDASILIDHRQGGTITSLTNAILYADGVTAETLQGREGGLIFGDNFWSNETAVMEDGSPNTTAMNAESFWRAVGGRNAPVGEAFVVEATNTRVREFTLGYNFSPSLFGNIPISGMRLSLVGRNLFFIHRASKNIDPDVLVGTGKAAEGFDSFAPPSFRSFGFNLSVDY
ncbi:MAG: SusC/RagA family TonB-linked outer membrane protein [Rhodothermaceae bacterium]|nr:SusC/RagA family TonB-linked outer membrane protein [Rhodothermaceae bacterium]MYG70118.1 SusC/RagA family TonB-linked outer membrane protein [Rhodothermaceae bacterium]